MQPLINLKQFLAVLTLLIIPAVLLTAYFRNYQPESGGGTAGHHAMGDASAPMADHHGGGEGKPPPADGQMDHSKMSGGKEGQASPAEPTQAQVEASRMQLEASRAQLEASRKLLEATPEAGQTPPAQPPGTAAPSGAQPPAKADGHAPHKH